MKDFNNLRKINEKTQPDWAKKKLELCQKMVKEYTYNVEFQKDLFLITFIDGANEVFVHFPTRFYFSIFNQNI